MKKIKKILKIISNILSVLLILLILFITILTLRDEVVKNEPILKFIVFTLGLIAMNTIFLVDKE